MSIKNAIFPADDNMHYSFHCYVNIATCPWGGIRMKGHDLLTYLSGGVTCSLTQGQVQTARVQIAAVYNCSQTSRIGSDLI